MALRRPYVATSDDLVPLQSAGLSKQTNDVALEAELSPEILLAKEEEQPGGQTGRSFVSKTDAIQPESQQPRSDSREASEISGLTVRERKAKSENRGALLNEIVKRSTGDAADPYADLKYLSSVLEETKKLTPLVRAIIYKPGVDATIDQKNEAMKTLLLATLEGAQKFVSISARTLKLTDDEKRYEMQKSITWVAELTANAWVLAGPEDMSPPSFDQILRTIRASRKDIDKLIDKCQVPEGFVQSSEDSSKLQTRTSVSKAIYPIANQLLYMAESDDPKLYGDVLETYKNYLVKDCVRFLDGISPDQMKISEQARAKAMEERIQQISTLIVSDLKAFFEKEGRMPNLEEIKKERIPVVRGMAYQVDSMVDAAMAGINLSKLKPEDISLPLGQVEGNVEEVAQSTEGAVKHDESTIDVTTASNEPERVAAKSSKEFGL